MAWGKVDDKLHASVKWRRASKGARALWTTSLSWCCDQENDGFVPKDMLRVLDGTPTEAKSLVDAGLWNKSAEGWEFHNWNKYNPDSASLRAKREAESEGGKRGNHARWHRKQGIKVPECEYCYPAEPDSGGPRVPDQGGDSGANPPVPARPGPSQSTSKEVDMGAPKRATQIPKSWTPTKEHYERAKKTALNFKAETEKFRNHVLEKGRTSKNWNLAFTNWLIKAAEYAHRNQGPQSTADRNAYSAWGKTPPGVAS